MIFFLIIQIPAYIWYCASYIPFARGCIKSCLNKCFKKSVAGVTEESWFINNQSRINKSCIGSCSDLRRCCLLARLFQLLLSQALEQLSRLSWLALVALKALLPQLNCKSQSKLKCSRPPCPRGGEMKTTLSVSGSAFEFRSFWLSGRIDWILDKRWSGESRCYLQWIEFRPLQAGAHFFCQDATSFPQSIVQFYWKPFPNSIELSSERSLLSLWAPLLLCLLLWVRDQSGPLEFKCIICIFSGQWRLWRSCNRSLCFWSRSSNWICSPR